jgi:uncharacterized protein DUF4410
MRLPYSEVSPTSISGDLPSAEHMRFHGSRPANQVESGPLHPMNRSRTGRIALSLIVLLTTGCASGKPVIWVDEGVSFSNYRAVEVRAVANDTEHTFDFDVAGSLTDKIRSKLVEHGVLLSEGGQMVEGTVVLKTSLTLYSPGNAAARWALPGAGATECIVKGALVDGQTGAQLGVLLSHRSVSAGGLFSAGADRWILDVTATDIADAVADRLRKR